MTAEVDELFDIKNAFYIGNFQTCINEAQRLKVSHLFRLKYSFWRLPETPNSFQPSNGDVTIERDVYMYRAYLAQQKYLIVKDEIGANSPQLIQPLKVLLCQEFIFKCFYNSIGNVTSSLTWGKKPILMVWNRSTPVKNNLAFIFKLS